MFQSNKLSEVEILKLLTEMSQVAKSAKRIEEITDAIESIASQTTLIALETTVYQRNSARIPKSLTAIGNTVKDATEEMYHQFNLLLEEVSDLERYLKSRKALELKESNLN